MPTQPQDEWTYLRPEEFADDDAVERIDEKYESSPEEGALHEVDLDAGASESAALDPGETVARATSDEVATQFFDDEEPDLSAESRATSDETDETDDEPRVDELLLSQHYAFEEDGQ
jgi:hypothetical protein